MRQTRLGRLVKWDGLTIIGGRLCKQSRVRQTELRGQVKQPGFSYATPEEPNRKRKKKAWSDQLVGKQEQ